MGIDAALREPKLIGTVRDALFEYRSLVHASPNSPSSARLAVNVLVLRTSRGLLLFDPGAGDPSVWIDGLDEQTRRMDFSYSGGLFSYLNHLGGAEAVSDIVLTHHHPDHFAALFTAFGRHCKVFPNARLFSPMPSEVVRYSRAYLNADDAYNIEPIPSQLLPFETFKSDCHCHNHTTYRLKLASGEILLVWGDLLPTAMHLRPKFRALALPDPPPFFFDLLDAACDRKEQSFLFHDPRRRIVRIGRSGRDYHIAEVVEPAP